MGKLAALIQAGDACTCDFGRNPLWAAVLTKAAGDSVLLDACCEIDSESANQVHIAPIFKSSYSYRHFAHLHPALALTWNRIGEELLEPFKEVSKRFSSVCFSNLRVNSPNAIAKKGLFDISWGLFNNAQQRLLTKAPAMGVMDLRDFFPSISPEVIERLLPKFVANTKLVDRVAHFIGELNSRNNRTGLPQASATSQIVAQLLLAPVDEVMERYGFLYARYVDDIRIAGRTTLEVGRDMAAFNALVEEAGFYINSDKTNCHPASRARCLPALGGCPDRVNIEDYVLDDNQHAVEQNEQSPYPLRASHPDMRLIAQNREPFDSVRLFEDHVGPSHTIRSKAVERYTIRQLSKRDHDLLRENELQLANSRFGAERLYAKSATRRTCLEAGIHAVKLDRNQDPAHQHRALQFLGEAATEHTTASAAMEALTKLYEAGIATHLEVEYCAIAREQQHRYAAMVPIVHRGMEECWPDVCVARIGAITGVEKEERNRLLGIAQKVRPAAMEAVRIMKSSNN